MPICKYCQKNEGKYLLFGKHWCCESSISKCPEVRKKNSDIRKKQIQNQIKDKIYKNPFKNYQIEHSAWNKGLTKESSESVKKYAETFKYKWRNDLLDKSKFKHSHTSITKEKLSIARCKILDKCINGFPHVKWYKVEDYNGIEWNVHGKWELNIAKKLNLENIKWTKNIQITYLDDIKRRYNPDFYLVDLDEYIEVKGYFSEKDKNKIQLVLLQHPEIKLKIIFENDYINFINNKIKYENIKYYQL